MNQRYCRPCGVYQQQQAQPQNSEAIKFRLQDLVAKMGSVSALLVYNLLMWGLFFFGSTIQQKGLVSRSPTDDTGCSAYF